ncbi:MAG: glycosyltransferase [archaeon]
MRVKIATRTDWPSFKNIATMIEKALKSTCTCTVHDWRSVRPGGNILFIDTVHVQALRFLRTLLPESNVVFYGTTEGLSRLDPESLAVTRQLSIVAVSNFVKQMLEQVGVPVCGVIHHALDMNDRRVDIGFYNRWKQRMKNKTVILTVSANHARKGLDRLLQAYKTLEEQTQQVFLIIHSQKAGYYNLERKAKELKIKRLWLTNLFGRMTQPRLNALYKLCSVYVQPSFSEGFGLPILEAFRFDKPVIAVDAPPFNEIILQGESGLLVRQDDVRWFNFENSIDFKMHIYEADDLAQAIISLTNQNLLRKMRRNIQQEKWRWDAYRLYPRLLDYFTETCPETPKVM